jgi:hypothetical protein
MTKNMPVRRYGVCQINILICISAGFIFLRIGGVSQAPPLKLAVLNEACFLNYV